MQIDIKLLYEDAKIPTRGSEYAAGWDLYAYLPQEEQEIFPHTTILINTGIAVSIPQNYFGGIFARSGLATKSGLRPANCTGVIDADYRGPVKVALHNDTDETKIVVNGDRIAQLVIIPCTNINLNIVNELDTTIRGTDGFGSTGV